MKYNKNGLLVLVAVSFSVLAAQAVAFDVAVSGFIRQEMAYKISNKENENNASGSKYNGSAHTLSGALSPLLAALGPLTYTDPDKSKTNDWNVFATRVEVDFNAIISENLTGFMKIRGYYQPDVFHNTTDSAALDGEGGRPNHFNAKVHGNEATVLSISDNDYMLDIPSLYLDYQKGPYWVRVGQQQIAWGEALFFRVADLANGLDFRRHVIMDKGSEEYSDERLASPAIRASMVFADNWEIEAFLQMFQPTILPPNYSHYNLIFNGFNPDWEKGFDKVDDQLNFGMRLQGNGLGEKGNWGVQFFAVARHNPDPVFDTQVGGDDTGDFLIERGIDKGLLGGGALDIAIGSLLNIPPGFESQAFAFEENGDGANSAAEWFYVAASGGVDGLNALNNIVADYEYLRVLTGLLGLEPNADGNLFTSILGGGHNTEFLPIPAIGFAGFPIPGGANATDFLELFFAIAQYSGRDSLVGKLDVSYASENVYGFGVNYIFYTDPDLWYDQLVVRFETSYTPNRRMTNNLARDHREEDEWFAYIGLEKYHRFSQSFPSTFLVFQYLFRKETDLLGRNLSDLGGDHDSAPGGGEDSRGWHGVVLAASQPFPNLTWRADVAVLYDFEGGFLFQPGVTYKPRAEWTVDAFANIIDGTKDTIFQPLDWSNDITVRVTYLF